MSRLLTVAETAQQLRISKSSALRLIHGEIPNQPPLPSVKLGRRRMVRVESLERFIAQAEQVESRQ